MPRKRSYRRKRVSRRFRKRVPRPMKGLRDLRQKVVYLKKSYVGTSYNTSGGVAFNFLLSSVPDYTSIQNLFDQYQVAGIKMTFMSESNVNVWNTDAGPPAAMIPLPRMTLVVDRDDSSVPGSENSLLEYNQRKIWRLDKPKSIYFKPSTLGAVYESAIATSYSPKQNVWISTADPDVPHYGLKYWFTNVSANVVIVTYITLYLKLRAGK